MVDSTISTAILIIAAVIATVATISAVFPSMFSAAGSIASATAGTDSRATTLLSITAHGFEGSTLHIWAKNGGQDSIPGADLERARLYYGNGAGPMTSYAMACSIEDPQDDDGNLDPGETLQITVAGLSQTDLAPGTHTIRLVLPSGASSEYTLTI